MDIRFDGKRALVTGAGKGIGRAICKALTECGAVVFALSKSKDSLETLKTESPGIHIHEVDITDWEEVEKVVKSCLPIHLLVNNAGVALLNKFVDATPQEFDRTFDVHVKATFFISQIVAKDMIPHDYKGSIVNVSSQSSQRALPSHTMYCSSKAALDMLTKCMALELGPHKIRVNSVNPTVVMTEMGRRVWGPKEKAEPMLARIPLGQFAEESDVVEPVLYLLSDKAAMVHGCTLPIEGGFWSV